MINGATFGIAENVFANFPRPDQTSKPEGAGDTSFLVALDFGKADGDASGDVTLDEFARGAASRADAESIFNGIDADGDGLVTAVEQAGFVSRLYDQFTAIAQDGPVQGGDSLIEIDGIAFGTEPGDAAASTDDGSEAGAAAETEGDAETGDTMSASEEAFMVAVEDRKKRPPIRDRDEDEGEIDSQTSSPDDLRRREAIIDQETERLKIQAESAYLGLRAIGQTDDRSVDAAA